MNTSAEARVVASFTFIVALLLGAWVSLETLIAGSSLLPGGLEISRVVIALVPFAATAVAYQAARASQAAWARTLGGAAVMLGGLTCLAAVLYFLANT